MTTDLPAQKRPNKAAPQQSDAIGAIGKSTAEYLMERYGPLLNANDLAEVLRFSGTLALERSMQRGHPQRIKSMGGAQVGGVLLRSSAT